MSKSMFTAVLGIRGVRLGMTGLFCLGAALVSGCGASDVPPIVKVYEVKGQVLLAGSKPLTNGKVSFVPTEAPFLLSSAKIGPDGTFTLTTGDSGTGAPRGQYKVRVEPEGPPPVVQGRRPNPKVLPYPWKYLDEDSSGLVVNVKAEPNQLSPFVLK